LSLSRVTLVIAAIVVGIAGTYLAFRALDERAAPPIVIEDAAATRPVVVDVRGAVAKPGVFELPPAARVQDAVAAAGGLTADADLSMINLARRVRDGEIVFVAAVPEAGTPIVAPAIPEASGGRDSARININTASAAELEQLPAIGEVIAGRIVAFREEHGPYRSVNDLIHVDGVSATTIDRLKDLVTTGP
jgi:competence protein ComEA